MTDLSRGARLWRGGRRPGWVLLTAVLAMAMLASAVMVVTDRVELLKLAVVLALWAAVIGAFVSVIYRRRSEADQARVHDLKLVYDLQLDREISARREYELTVESQLRRELTSEFRTHTAEELATLRAELRALRTSLEIWFDTNLEDHRALETTENEAPGVDWVTSDRVDHQDDSPHHQDDSPRLTADGSDDNAAIIDVPEVGDWAGVDSSTLPNGPEEPLDGSPVSPHMAADHPSRHRGLGPLSGRSVADLLERLQVQPSGRRRRRDE